MRDVPTSPRPNGAREGPAKREGEGDARLSHCCRKQMSSRIFPLTFPSLTRWALLSDCRRASPRGARKRPAMPNAIALPSMGEGRVGGDCVHVLTTAGTGGLLVERRACGLAD